MSERIQQTCTVHKSDVYAVLVALEDVITDALKAGEIVRLGDLGSLQIGISSKGAETEDDFNDALIKKARINFRPGSAIAGVLSNLTFAKVKPRYSKADKETEDGNEEGGEDLTD
jgi:predicted histone-like DNA-binding protein